MQRDDLGERPGDDADVVADPGEQVAGAGRLELGRVEVERAVEDLLAQVGQRGLGDPGQQR